MLQISYNLLPNVKSFVNYFTLNLIHIEFHNILYKFL